MLVQRGEWALVSKFLPEFPQCSIVCQLISVQVVHDVIVRHHVSNLTSVVFCNEEITFLFAFESIHPGLDDGGLFLGSIIISMEK